MLPLRVLQISGELACLHPSGKRCSEEIILSLYLDHEANSIPIHSYILQREDGIATDIPLTDLIILICRSA